MDRNPPNSASEDLGHNVCFRAAGIGRSTTQMVKVFGCRQAYENRPSTNPRGCGDGLWGFRASRG
jgi:hypothetical protein